MSRSRQRLRHILLVVSAALWAVACGGSAQVASSEAPEDSTVSLTGEFATISGETVDLAGFAGSDVVLWFWAPW